ncbi:MAG TPA: amidohydrolase family protein [Acidimicrobiales bacterium]|nr:amidohydrolase family protein [Acidimicrobiales bacterium]
MVTKLWANSGDSHATGEVERWREILPSDLAERMPRSVKDADGEFETVHVDGRTFRRKLPKLLTKTDKSGRTIGDLVSERGAKSLEGRLADLDQEGVWGEVVYASLGLWESLLSDRHMIREVTRLQNEYVASEVAEKSGHRLVPAASVPLLDIDDAVAEVEHMAEIGLRCVSLPTGLPDGMPALNRDDWEPLWAACEAAGMVLGVHIGTDGGDDGPVRFRGPGGAVLNYVDTTYGGQRVATQLVSSGALDRHPGLRVLISEGGATWVPFLGDRMNEGYRQHATFVRPVLSRLPKEILYDQVYTSFQHDESAPAAMWAMGYRNILWGSDYPHIEGTFGHTQKTLHELFDDVTPEVSHRIRIGAFRELFPHVPSPPAE